MERSIKAIIRWDMEIKGRTGRTPGEALREALCGGDGVTEEIIERLDTDGSQDDRINAYRCSAKEHWIGRGVSFWDVEVYAIAEGIEHLDEDGEVEWTEWTGFDEAPLRDAYTVTIYEYAYGEIGDELYRGRFDTLEEAIAAARKADRPDRCFTIEDADGEVVRDF